MKDLTEMQSKLLEMLKYLHEFCIENNIRYYVIGGTLLGAVRHNGFIPWDDDIDVGLPREDYERLIKLFPKKDSRYILESVYSADENFCYSFSKMYDTTTTLIENTTKHLKRGIYIDIFPLDGAGNTKEEVIKTFAPINRKKNLLTLRIVKLSANRKWYKNILLWTMQHLPSSICGEKKLCLDINKLCKKNNYDDSNFVGNLVGAWGKKEIMPKKLFGKPTLHKFENIEVFIQEDFDGYLTYLYGDWRKLPPEEKRVSHHDYELDLNHSYLS